MSANPQFRSREGVPTADPELLIAAPAPGRDDPLELLREAIARLNSSKGEFPDQARLANVLAEARQALERANVLAGALAQCEKFLKETQFNQAFEALDAGLRVYPADPALIARRREVEERQKAFHSAEAVRTALEEAQWLADQDRPDLAAHSLKEKAAELPDQPALISRLEELDALLPQWEQNRNVRAALGRSATLEQLQQWQVALTILEEALQSYPASEELIGEVRRARDRLADHDRRRKLARRLEMIGQKIDEQCWRQALTLLENTQKEFPGAPELSPLRRQAEAGLRRSECEAIVTEVRQCLVDDELEQAEQALRRGLESLGQEPALEALREELESDKKYREELRTAQILFGRRQLQEAERVLTRMAAQNRPEAMALLHAVREAHAATEEEKFYERGREKALTLIQQQQYAQAADLLRNLLSLFPGNPILERDLMAARSGLGEGSSEVVRATGEENCEPQAPVIPAAPEGAPQPETQTRAADRGPVRESAPSSVRRAAIAGAASLVLVSASGAAWKLSRSWDLPPKGAPVSRMATRPAGAPLPAATPLPVTQEDGSPGATPLPITSTAPGSTGPGRTGSGRTGSGKVNTQPEPPPAKPLRQFVSPATQQTPVQVQSSLLPLPPGTGALISVGTIPGLPAELVKSVNAPTPPPAAPTQPAASAPAPAPKPAVPSGGRLQEPQLISRTLPDYPALARQRGVFGVVRMEAVVDEYGAVNSVKVMSGDPVLAAAAKTAVLKWKYQAATLNGQPIAINVAIQVSFGDRKK